MPHDMFWGGAPVPLPSGRDEAIAAGAELDELGYVLESEDAKDESDDELAYYNPQTGKSAPKSSATGKAKSSRRRVPGGIAPISKRLTTNYDSDDARIIELKQQLYSDEYVANKLQQEGRMRYTAKTVSSRYRSLKRLIDEKAEQKLDEELSDWHVGEDDSLNSIFEIIEQKYEQQRLNLELKKWKDVSLHLEHKIGKRKYTGKACRERYESLKNGTALMPIELDPDQVGRRKLREDRIAAAKKKREDAEEAALRLEREKLERNRTKKREQAEANQKRVISKMRKNLEKEERLRVREERRVNKEKIRVRQMRILAQMRLERDWELAKARAEKKLYHGMGGQGSQFGSRTGRSRARNNGYDTDEEEEAIDEFESDDEEAQFVGEEEEEESEPEESEDEEMGNRTPVAKSTSSRRRSSGIAKTASSAPKPHPSKPIEVTEETLLNPRIILDDKELDILLYFRRLPRRENETHAEVVARIAAADEELKSDDLDELLAHASEKQKGKKMEKIRRLQEADAKKSKFGEMGYTAQDPDFMKLYPLYHTPRYHGILEAARQRRDSVMAG